MSNLIIRLNAFGSDDPFEIAHICQEAAARIEALEATMTAAAAQINANTAHINAAADRIEVLEEALKQIADLDPKAVRADDLGRAARIARHACNAFAPEQDK